MINILLVFVLITQLVLLPVALDIGQAQTGNSSIIIAHQPIRIGYRGKPLNIVTNVNDDVGVKRVSVVVNYGNNTKTGNMPVLSRGAKVPVQVGVLRDARVYSSPTKGRVKGKVYRGEVLLVTRSVNNYYRILTDGGLYGYVEAENLNLVKTGKSYGVSLPAELTNYPFITYQIVVTDARGNIAKSKMNKVRLLTQDEVAQLRARRSTKTASSESTGTQPSYTKYYVLAGLVVLSGGVYYLVTKQDDKSDSGTTVVGVEAEWQ